RAQDQADRCVADARATASALTEECDQRLRELRGQAEAAQGERDRLLGDLRTISTALVTVADAADERIPAKPHDTTAPSEDAAPGTEDTNAEPEDAATRA